MDSKTTVKWFVALLLVVTLGGCAPSENTQSAADKSSSDILQNSNISQSTLTTQESDNAFSELAAITEELEKAQAEVNTALDGRVLALNEQMYFMAKDNTLRCIGGSGGNTQDLAFLKQIYPDLIVADKILEFDFSKATIQMSDNLASRKVEVIPSQQKAGEIYKTKLQKKFITMGTLTYKSDKGSFEIDFYNNDIADILEKQKAAIKAAEIIAKGESEPVNAEGNYTYSWTKDSYTYQVTAQSEETLNRLVQLKISEVFAI